VCVDTENVCSVLHKADWGRSRARSQSRAALCALVPGPVHFGRSQASTQCVYPERHLTLSFALHNVCTQSCLSQAQPQKRLTWL
jgi:hypothetical protein